MMVIMIMMVMMMTMLMMIMDDDADDYDHHHDSIHDSSVVASLTSDLDIRDVLPHPCRGMNGAHRHKSNVFSTSTAGTSAEGMQTSKLDIILMMTPNCPSSQATGATTKLVTPARR